MLHATLISISGLVLRSSNSNNNTSNNSSKAYCGKCCGVYDCFCDNPIKVREVIIQEIKNKILEDYNNDLDCSEFTMEDITDRLVSNGTITGKSLVFACRTDEWTLCAEYAFDSLNIDPIRINRKEKMAKMNGRHYHQSILDKRFVVDF
jgi:hypothetical protein